MSVDPFRLMRKQIRQFFHKAQTWSWWIHCCNYNIDKWNKTMCGKRKRFTCCSF
ncbi:hypothetical protein V6Z11_A13G111800 [Gossypium hirsutum]